MGFTTGETKTTSNQIPLYASEGITHFDFSAGLPLTVGAVSITPNAHFQVNVDDETKFTSGTQANGKTVFTIGTTLSWSRGFGEVEEESAEEEPAGEEPRRRRRPNDGCLRRPFPVRSGGGAFAAPGCHAVVAIPAASRATSPPTWNFRPSLEWFSTSSFPRRLSDMNCGKALWRAEPCPRGPGL